MMSRLALTSVLSGLFIVGWLAGCDTTVRDFGDGGSGGGGSVTCGAGTTQCGDVCVDTSSDPNNCGGCGATCASPANATAACTDGVCTLSCGANYGDCNADAADGCETNLASNFNHCGACGNGCTDSAACANGQCVPDNCDGGGVCDGCIACAVEGLCAAEYAAFMNNPEAQALDQCVFGTCNGFMDQACVDGCIAQHPDGQADYFAAVTCVVCVACVQDCMGTLNCP